MADSSQMEDLIRRAELYGQSRELNVNFQDPLGRGIDGSVWTTSRPSALKLFERQKNYCDEAECYRRRSRAKIGRIQGFAVPKLIDIDEQFMAVEMTVVSRPYLLDFGKVYLDSPPHYWNEPEIMADWHTDGRENFGERWSAVLSLLGARGSSSAFGMLIRNRRTIMFDD